MLNSILLKHFKSVYVTEKTENKDNFPLKKQALEKGIVFEDSIYNLKDFNNVLKCALDLYGIDLQKLNATFYKSLKESDNYTEEEKNVLQYLHYLSHYGGFKELANDGEVFTVNNVDLIDEGFAKNFTFIKALYSIEEVKELILSLVNSGIALNSDLVDDLTKLVELLSIKFSVSEIENVKNREFKNYLYKVFDIVPKDVDTFMKLVFEKLGNAVITKSDMKLYLSGWLGNHTSNSFKYSKVEDMFKRYEQLYGLKTFARNSNRWREILLLLRKHGIAVKEINKITRLSKKYSVPKKKPFIERVLETENWKEFLTKVKELNNFQLVRLYNTIQYRLNDFNGKEVYVIRNSKLFYKQEATNLNSDIHEKGLIILDILKQRVSEKLKDKTVRLPKDVVLAFPTSEKNFLAGVLPFGSRIELPKDSVVGIHWEVIGDVDLHAIGYKHIGFSGSKDGFSGDMIGLNRNGYAAEYIRLSDNLFNDTNTLATIRANLFNGIRDYDKVKLVLGKKYKGDRDGVIVSKEDVILQVPFKATLGGSTVGVIKQEENSLTYYFGGNSSIGSIYNVNRLKEVGSVFISKMKNQLTINDILDLSNVTIVTDDSVNVDYDLSLETLTSQQIIELFA